MDPFCEDCDCEDDTALDGLADECECDCHTRYEPDYDAIIEARAEAMAEDFFYHNPDL